MKNEKIPKGALRFVSQEDRADVFSAEEGGVEKLRMTVYSGGIIKNHWWWGDLAMDLSGVKFTKPTYPVLENHLWDRKVGFSKKPVVDEKGLHLDPETTEFVDTEASIEFKKLSKQGFPYQSSLYGVPSKIQRLSEKEEVEVNGFKMKGPGTVWREWEYKEGSVCVFGWDDKTKASAFSREETEEVSYMGEVEDENNFSKTLEGGERSMDYETLKKENPDLFSQILEEGKKMVKEEIEQKFSDERQAFQGQFDSLSQKFTAQEEKIAKMDKELTLSREETLKIKADKLFSEIFAESEIPVRLESKVRSQINHQKFVKDDALDVEAFTKAVEDELKDWEDRMPKSGVQGFSVVSDPGAEEEADQGKFSEENKAVAGTLLSLVGQGKK